MQGLIPIAMDMKEGKLTVTGTVDPVKIVSKLRKYWPTTAMILVGPAKEPEKEKKEEPKKEEGKKEDGKKEEEPKKEGKEEPKKEEPKKDEAKKEEPKKEKEEEKKPDPILELIKAYKQMPYNPPVPRYYYQHVPSMEENPNACTIV
ncbi:Heavy metal-associated isoprenylated plant protein 39 [Ancistrocladus abbreviatus]